MLTPSRLKGREVVEKTLHKQVFDFTTLFSGAEGRGTETRSYQQNRKSAFNKLVRSEKFQKWHKAECARRLGQSQELEKTLDDLLLDKHLKIEYY